MSSYEEELEAANDPATVQPMGMFGYKDGEAWVADDVFVTRCRGGDVLVERWDGRGVRTATVRKDTTDWLRAMWIKLNEVAMDVAPYPPQ